MNSRAGILSTFYPVLFLIGGILFFLNVLEEAILNGVGQLLLLVSGFISILPSLVSIVSGNKEKRRQAEKVLHLSLQYSLAGIRNVLEAIGILLLVGGIIASWSASGILPTLIQLGFVWMDSKFFLVSACVACAFVSILSGSSWTTVGTIGLVFIGMGEILGFYPPLVAGAILSGAYFGDKMSPLSDTTNLASGIAKVPLSEHIRFMLPTTLASLGIALGLYFWIGFYYGHKAEWNLEILDFLREHYPIEMFRVLIPFIVIAGVGLGLPAIPSLGIGVIFGVFVAFYEGKSAKELLEILFQGFHSHTGNQELDFLLSGGGVVSMLPTVFLILSAMVFGGCMEGSGKIGQILYMIRPKLLYERQLVLYTMYFSYIINLTTCDQYLSIVIPGRTLKNVYQEMGADPRLLSRALEDSGTITSALIPWNSCGAFLSATLGVSVLKYFPFCFFHWIQILLSIILTMIHIRTEKKNPKVESFSRKDTE